MYSFWLRAATRAGKPVCWPVGFNRRHSSLRRLPVAVNKSSVSERVANPPAVPVTLNQVATEDNSLFKHFGKGFEPDVDAFEGMDVVSGENGLPLLTKAIASMEGCVVSQMDAGDHVIYLLDITTATTHADSPDVTPFVHLRRNGFRLLGHHDNRCRNQL